MWRRLKGQGGGEGERQAAPGTGVAGRRQKGGGHARRCGEGEGELHGAVFEAGAGAQTQTRFQESRRRVTHARHVRGLSVGGRGARTKTDGRIGRCTVVAAGTPEDVAKTKENCARSNVKLACKEIGDRKKLATDRETDQQNGVRHSSLIQLQLLQPLRTDLADSFL